MPLTQEYIDALQAKLQPIHEYYSRLSGKLVNIQSVIDMNQYIPDDLCDELIRTVENEMVDIANLIKDAVSP